MTDMTTPAELLRLSESATPGKWLPDFNEVVIDTRAQECCGNRRGEECCEDPIIVGEYYNICTGPREDDASLIAAAVNFIRSDAFRQMADSQAECERLRAELAETKVAFDQARGMLTSALNDLGLLMDRATAAEAECAGLRKAVAKEIQAWREDLVDCSSGKVTYSQAAIRQLLNDFEAALAQQAIDGGRG